MNHSQSMYPIILFWRCLFSQSNHILHNKSRHPTTVTILKESFNEATCPRSARPCMMRTVLRWAVQCLEVVSLQMPRCAMRTGIGMFFEETWRWMNIVNYSECFTWTPGHVLFHCTNHSICNLSVVRNPRPPVSADFQHCEKQSSKRH